RRMVARDEGVAAYDPGDETRPAGAAAHLHEKVAGVTDSVQVLGDLLDRPVRSREAPLLLVGQPRGLGRIHAVEIGEQLEDVGGIGDTVVIVVLPRAVPRPIRAEDDVLGHRASPPARPGPPGARDGGSSGAPRPSPA